MARLQEGFKVNGQGPAKPIEGAGLKPYQRNVPESWEIPHELHDLPIWCAWELVQVPGKKKPDKRPVSPLTGKRNGWNRPGFCTTVERAIHYAEGNSKMHGIGLVLSPEHGLIGGDLDQCRNPETGEASPLAREIIQTADTYTEVSPGLTGFRFIARGTFGGYVGNNQEHHVEFYESGRFLTFTAEQVDGAPFSIEQRDLTILGRRFHHRGEQSKGKAQEPPLEGVSGDLSDFPDLDRIPVHVRQWIVEGVPEGKDRSTVLYGAAKDLLRPAAERALSPENEGKAEQIELDAKRQTLSILSHPENGISACALERRGGDLGSAQAWIWEHNILKAWTEVLGEAREQFAQGDSTEGGSDTKDSGSWYAVDFLNQLSLPPFDLSLLPSAIARYARDQAELMGVDPAVIAMAALGACAGCLDDRIQVQVKRHDKGWTESARLWIGIIGDPSAKKSPGLKKAMAPLSCIDRRWRQESDKAMAEYLAETEGLKKGEQKPPPPILKRLIVNDATVEKLADIASTHEPRGMLSFQDELSGWLSSMDVYKNGGNKDRANWLEAYNGGPRAIDRVNRGSSYCENWSFTVLGGIQPSFIHAYANATNHDGMLQRFILIQAGRSSLGVDRPVDGHARDTYMELAEHLAAIKPPEPESDNPVVRLSEEAHQIREALDEKIHRIGVNHPNKHLSAALGKWSGAFARLALTFHCIEFATFSDYPTSRPISEETAQRVSDLMTRVLLPNAISFYEGLDPSEEQARHIAGLILARGWARFTVKRDLSQNMRAFRKLKPWEQDEALDRLETFGWIHPEPGKAPNERGRPKAYIVNPSVHERFAEQAEAERQRRTEEREVLRELWSD